MRWGAHLVSLGLAIAVALVLPASAAESTRDVVQKRGQLSCGSNGQLPGFSFANAVGEWSGLDAEFCRALAAATLGDASKVKFVPLTAADRFNVLAGGSIDVLVRNTTINFDRAVGTPVRYATVNYYDGQAFAVAKSAGIDHVPLLSGKTVCTIKGSVHFPNMEGYFSQRLPMIQPVFFDTQRDMFNAFFMGECVAVTADATALAATIVTSGNAANYLMLPEIIGRSPLGPYVRRGDESWLDIVRWTHFAMIAAEENDVTRANVDEMLKSPEPAIRRLLGVEPGTGKALGLDDRWAYNVIKQVGNYGESYERNVGRGSPLRFSRGINALMKDGGLMYALPLH